MEQTVEFSGLAYASSIATDTLRADEWGGASIVCEGGSEPPDPNAAPRPTSRPLTSPRLGDQARAAMRLRHFSPRTEKAYLHWMRRYYDFHGRRDPRDLGPEHVTAFLTDLAERHHVAASTQNQALAALLFFYREVIGRDLPWLDDLVRARRPARRS